MKMRSALVAGCLTIAALVGSTAAQAASYDLTTDFSNTNNKNGDWSYLYGAALLPHQPKPVAANPTNPAISPDGYFSTGSDLNTYTPDVFKAAANGSDAGLKNSDFLSGDIIIHSPNDEANELKPLSIVWTAPSAGTISNLIASVWYTHSSVDRSNDVSLTLAGVLLDSWVISKTAGNDPNFDRTNPASFTGASFSVNAGDLLSLSFLKTAGQQYGSLNGVAESFTFTAAVTPTPIPASLPLLVTAIAGLGWIGHRRHKAA
jgi:hypothetical protein